MVKTGNRSDEKTASTHTQQEKVSNTTGLIVLNRSRLFASLPLALYDHRCTHKDYTLAEPFTLEGDFIFRAMTRALTSTHPLPVWILARGTRHTSKSRTPALTAPLLFAFHLLPLDMNLGSFASNQPSNSNQPPWERFLLIRPEGTREKNEANEQHRPWGHYQLATVRRVFKLSFQELEKVTAVFTPSVHYLVL